MDIEMMVKGIKGDIEECIERSKKALGFLDEGKYEEAGVEMAEVEASADFVVSELDTIEEAEEKKEEEAETTPPPQPSPPEQTPAPAESPV